MSKITSHFVDRLLGGSDSDDENDEPSEYIVDLSVGEIRIPTKRFVATIGLYDSTTSPPPGSSNSITTESVDYEFGELKRGPPATAKIDIQNTSGKVDTLFVTNHEGDVVHQERLESPIRAAHADEIHIEIDYTWDIS